MGKFQRIWAIKSQLGKERWSVDQRNFKMMKENDDVQFFTQP